MKRYEWAMAITTGVLVIYTFLSQIGAPYPLLSAIFTLSPFLVGWMVYQVLRNGEYHGPELGRDQEYGYEDFTPRQA